MNQVSSGSPSTVIFSTITPLSSDVPSYVNGTSVLMTGLPQSISTSMNAMCGPATGQTCLGSTYGPCCSKSGWCGNDDSYCGFGCQESWGTCGKQITEPGRKLIKHRHHGRRRGWASSSRSGRRWDSVNVGWYSVIIGKVLLEALYFRCEGDEPWDAQERAWITYSCAYLYSNQ